MSLRSLFVVPALLTFFPAWAVNLDEGSAGQPSITATRSQDRVGLLQATQGLAEIRAGNYREASRLFNVALKFEPENAHLHFLNGFSYHLLYSQGHRANRDLAETAYALALQLAPDHLQSAYYLGLLHLESRQYTRAQAAFASALLIEREAPMVLQGLAVASYYAHDLGMAVWAIERVEQTREPDADTLRAAAIIFAAAGRVEEALLRTRQLKQLTGADSGDYVDKRVRHWLSFHESNRGRLYRTASQTIPLTPESSSDTAAQPAPLPVPRIDSAVMPGATPLAAAGDILRNWSDCPQNAAPANGSSPYSSTFSDNSAFRDETAQLPALPSPCDRKTMPRMALLDTAIISTVENTSTNKGINLLDGLRLMLGVSFTDNNQAASGKRIKTYSRTAALDNLGGAGSALAYSLNIANAGNDWNQVLARPTLVALDRQPSTFFSGNSLTTTVQGAYSGGTLVEHPAGISLSVTPTFVDDEQLLLSVRVSRSYFVNGSDLRGDTIIKSRNAVSANVLMKMGETLILSGLTERQLNESKNGVPLLKDIPVLQYLFSAETKNDFTQSILVMITPRPPVTGNNTPAASPEMAPDPRQASSLKELRQEISSGLRPAPNLDVIFLDMEDNRLFREFRTGDLRAEDWRRAPFIERTLKEIAEFLYY
jgi:general secretion pathway protein D